MEKTDVEGDPQGQNLEVAEVAEEAGDLGGEANGEVKDSPRTSAGATRQAVDDLPSDEDISQNSNLEDISEDHLNGTVTGEEDSGRETEELHVEKHDIGEVVEVVEEIEVIEERQEASEGGGAQQKPVETEAAEDEELVEKKKIKFIAADLEDLDFSDGPDSQGPETEEEEESVGELPEDEPGALETVLESTYDREEKEVDLVQERLQSQKDLVDSEPETKEEDLPAKDLRNTTKEPTKEKDVQEETDRPQEAIQRRSSTENFQKLKDRFSSETKVEENNRKNSEGEKESKDQENEIARGASNMSEAKSKRFGGTSEKCTQCSRTVYPMEKMEVAGRLLHKTCFKCCKCNSQLNVGRFSIGGKDMYCMTHYKQAFREKGTYDVFTPENPIKGKWENKA